MGRKVDRGTGSFAALLRRYRGAKGFTQEELADRAGLHAQEISQLERGVVRNPRSTTVEFLADALQLDAQERGAFAAAARGESAPLAHSSVEDSERVSPSPVSRADAEALLASVPTDVLTGRATLPAGSRMPLAPNPLFVGRNDELLEVARALKGGNATVAPGQVVTLTGLGGLGKTQLAVEFVHRYGRFFAGGVYWLSFATAEEVPLQVATCAGPGAMDLAPGIESLPLEERVQRVRRAWQSAVPRLIVFDNCEDESLLDAWRPTSGGCRLLVTSRRSHWSPTLGVTALPLDLLPRADSIELLRRYRPDLAADNSPLDPIADRLGDLPLALHLAGSYLGAYRAEVSLDDYLAELDRPDVIRHASLLGEGLDDSPSPTHHVQSVAQTFALCLGRLDREREVDEVAIKLLARMACMAPGEPVPRDLLNKTLEEVEPRRRVDGLRRLGAVGLLEEGDGWLQLHRLLVHFVRQEGLDPTAPAAVAWTLIACSKEAYRGRLTGLTLASVLPHLVDAASAAVRGTGDEQLAAEVCAAASRALKYTGDLRAARPWCERALAIREQMLGSGHPDTADGLDDLAGLLYAQGELAAARSFAERAVAIRERELGPDHPDTAESLEILGWLYRELGQPEDARAYLERVLGIRERALGPDHLRTADAMSNLANALMDLAKSDLARLADARPLHEQSVRIYEQVLGPDHADTAVTLSNLAHLLMYLGELDAAQTLFDRSRAIREREFGPHHPETANSLVGLATLLWKRCDLEGARRLFERALGVQMSLLGSRHPRTAIVLHQLAGVHLDQGDRACAAELCNRAVAIFEDTVRPGHPWLIESRQLLKRITSPRLR